MCTQPVGLIQGLYFKFAIGQSSEMTSEEIVGGCCRTNVAECSQLNKMICIGMRTSNK